MKVVTFKVSDELLKEVDEIAKRERVTRSEIIRKALELYVRLWKKRELPKEPKRVRLTS